MLVDRPRKFVIQFPGNDGHEHCAQSQDTRNRHEERFGIGPIIRRNIVEYNQLIDGVLDLFHLHGGVDEQPDIVDAETNDLNCVFKS